VVGEEQFHAFQRFQLFKRFQREGRGRKKTEAAKRKG
jgi:hypothetical protein